MQRQDDFQITRKDMLLFIAQLLSLAEAVIRIVAQCRTIDDRLLHAFVRSEYAMLIVLGGIVSNTDTRGATPGLNDIIEFDEPPDRHAELLRIGASLQQIAMALALLLAMNPRVFRDRRRASIGVICAHFAGTSLTRSISGARIPHLGCAMTSRPEARAPP